MNLGNRASQHNFANVPSANIPRSKFNRSFALKTTFDADFLIPIMWDEVLPGDTHNLSLTSFGRLATPIVPIMDNIYLDYHFFFIPTRLVWDNFQKFMGEQENPGDSTDFLFPQAATTTLTVTANSLQNYLGIKEGTLTLEHSPVRADVTRSYNLVWNEFYRDQNLQDSVIVDKDDGPDDPSNYTLLKRGKRHDYFTSCLPFPQKGPAVEIPLGTRADVGTADYISNGGSESLSVKDHSTGSWHWIQDRNSPFTQFEAMNVTERNQENGSLYADLSTATAATINSLREAFQIQRLYERDARGGTRYIELVKSHFGVVSPDARLQRPEFLGGGTVPVNINPIAQTSSTDATTPQGNLAAMGTTVARNIGFQKSFTEHGIILGLVSARADITYQQGLDRGWSRRTKFDFYWPALAHLGEQEVKNSEIYISNSSTDAETFGYQERYAEYRYKPSQILGTFSSLNAQSLDIWHLAQDFANQPVLNDEFIENDTPIDRIIATPTEPHFILDVWFKYTSARPMPTYSVPGLIDHL